MVEDCEGYGVAVVFIMGSWVSETAYLCLESGQRIPVVETFSVFRLNFATTNHARDTHTEFGLFSDLKFGIFSDLIQPRHSAHHHHD